MLRMLNRFHLHAPASCIQLARECGSTLACILWAIDHKINIINLSLNVVWKPEYGDPDASELHQAIIRATEAGILVVASAGNTGQSEPLYPTAFPEVISVSAVNQTFTRDAISSYGDHVDFCAPGRNILSTDLRNSIKLRSGTSMAAAYVSGILALWKEAYPLDSNPQLLKRIQSAAKDMGPQGVDPECGHGLIQAPGQPETGFRNTQELESMRPILHNKSFHNGLLVSWSSFSQKPRQIAFFMDGNAVEPSIQTERFATFKGLTNNQLHRLAVVFQYENQKQAVSYASVTPKASALHERFRRIIRMTQSIQTHRM